MHPRILLPLLILIAALAVGLWYQPPPVSETEVRQEPPAEFDFHAWAGKIEDVRKLKFVSVPKLSAVTAEQLQAQRLAAARREISPEQGSLRIREMDALGFRWLPDYPWVDTLAGLWGDSSVTWFDSVEGIIYIDTAVDLAHRPDAQDELMVELTKALLLQNFPQLQPHEISPPNDDAARARDALLHGDALQTAVRLRIQEPPEAAPSTAISQPYWQTPQAFRQLVLFPKLFGRQYADQLRARDSAGNFDKIYQHLPKSTAEILTTTERKPSAVELPEIILPGWSKPMENTLGALGVMTLLRGQLTSQQADAAVQTWRGDRYRFYARPDPVEDALIWKSEWRSSADAREFQQVVFQYYLSRYGLLDSPEAHAADGALIVNAGTRQVKIYPPLANAVSVIVAVGTTEFLKAVEAGQFR